MGKVLALHEAGPGSIPPTPRGLPSLPEVIPGHRAMSKPWTPLGVSPKPEGWKKGFKNTNEVEK